MTTLFEYEYQEEKRKVEEERSGQLEVRVEQQIGLLNWNFEELNKLLDLQLKKYDGLVFNDQEINEAKKIRANLNKVAKTINDRKIEVKKQFCEPYDRFAEQAKQLTEKINTVSKKIDVQVKDFEQRQKDEKRKQIEEFWKEVGNPYIPLERIFDEKWLNSSVKEDAWKKEIRAIREQIQIDIIAIGRFPEDQLNWMMADYTKTVNLSQTMLNWEKHLKEIQRAEEFRKAQEAARIEALAKKNETAEQEPAPVEIPRESKKMAVWWTITAELQGTTEDMRWLNDGMKARGMKIKVIDRRKEEK